MAGGRSEREINASLIADITYLHPYEKRWVDRQPWLLQRGYELRPRFRPGWAPSWRRLAWMPSWAQWGYFDPFEREDSLSLDVCALASLTRILLLRHLL